MKVAYIDYRTELIHADNLECKLNEWSRQGFKLTTMCNNNTNTLFQCVFEKIVIEEVEDGSLRS